MSAAPAHMQTATLVATDGIPLTDALFLVGVIVASLISVAMVVSLFTRSPAQPSILLEVPLGEFRFGAGANRDRMQLEFRAIALVGGSLDDQSDKAAVLSRHSARVSQAIEEAGRGATTSELIEPDLKAFRSRVRDRVNLALGTYLVDDVLVHNFHVFEQNVGLANSNQRLDRNDRI